MCDVDDDDGGCSSVGGADIEVASDVVSVPPGRSARLTAMTSDRT